jgi:lipopolysaccharide/colanic/teichoic acid biosynthesis glycosyltransferase
MQASLGAETTTEHAYLRAGNLADGLKRLFDVIVALSALILLAPLFALIAICIKLDSPGPVFFRQVRIGRHRRRFLMWKFRKMRHDLSVQGPSLTRRYDVRLTPMGRLLERTKLDELPQLINVLAGDMSIVGPRPEVPKFVEHYPDEWTRVLSVRPGLVGPSQLRLRNESELYPDGCIDVEEYYAEHILPEKLAVDGAYADGHNLWSDFVLLMRTFPATVAGILTRRTLVNRRWQAVNALGLIVISAAGSLVAVCALGPRFGLDPAWQLVGIALTAKIIALGLFDLPASMASSVTAADMHRCCWCATLSGLLAGSALLAWGYGEPEGLVVVADTVAFTALLMIYKLACYNLYVLFRLQRSRDLERRLTVAALILGPLSAALTLARHPVEHWTGERCLVFLGIVLLAMVVRPGAILFNPMPSIRRGLSWVVTEWAKLAFGALAGSFLLLVALFALGERATAPRDAAWDAVLYLALITAVALWHQRSLTSTLGRQPETAPQRATAKERLLVVGTGFELSAYLSALLILAERGFEIVGAIVAGTGHRSNTVAGVRVVGEVADVPGIVSTLGVTKVVVVGSSGDDSILTYLREACVGVWSDNRTRTRIARIDFVEPLCGNAQIPQKSEIRNLKSEPLSLGLDSGFLEF